MARMSRDDWLQSLMKQVSLIREAVTDLDMKLRDIDRFHGRILASISESEQKALRRQAEMKSNECNRQAKDIRMKLKGKNL
jgi:uncharacterized protein (DUF2141 family)